MTAAFEPVDIVSFTLDIASNFTYSINNAGVTLLTSQCDRFKREHESLVTAYVDRDMWERLVLNLLSNAIKYTPHGGQIELAFSVTTHDTCPNDNTQQQQQHQQSQKAIEFSIRDTGIGIPEDALPHLFQRFYRVDKHAGNTQGTS